MFKKFAHSVFFGNYFYGCCTVALAVETNVQLNIPLNNVYFYVLLFCATVLFYTYAYIEEKNTALVKQSKPHLNKRSKWYYENRTLVKKTQITLFVACAAIILFFLIKYYDEVLIVTPLQITGLVFTGIVAFAYYGISLGSSFKINTRSTGWFKPFAIGLVWATAVTYVPVLWYQVEQNVHYTFTRINLWFFVKNFMYISLLAILFDIKDYAADHNRRLKTFVVQMGLYKTIFLLIVPLIILGFLSFIAFAVLMHFPALRIIINSIPFVLLVIIAWSMQRRKSILYYLVVIDGLMLVKALCGITAYLLVK